MYLEIQHNGDQVKLIYHSHPEADGPLLTWGEIDCEQAHTRPWGHRAG